MLHQVSWRLRDLSLQVIVWVVSESRNATKIMTQKQDHHPVPREEELVVWAFGISSAI